MAGQLIGKFMHSIDQVPQVYCRYKDYLSARSGQADRRHEAVSRLERNRSEWSQS